MSTNTEVTYFADSVEIRCETVSEREVLPQCEKGIDWSAERLVVARTEDGSKTMWWKKSGSYWVGILCPRGISAVKLMLCDITDPRVRTIQVGGRLSRKSFQKNADVINDFFGCEIAQFLIPTYTTIIKEIKDIEE